MAVTIEPTEALSPPVIPTSAIAPDMVTESMLADSKAVTPKRKKTAGETLFNRVVYTVIGFFVNEVSSLWVTDQFLNGKNLLGKTPLKGVGKWFSKEGYDDASAWLAKAFKVKDTAKVSGKAKTGNLLLMVTLLSGGTLLLLPMKWLEDHKIYWVQKANHWMDRWHGNKLSTEQVAARDKEVEQAIACSPRQSWPSMLLGRVVACMASVGTGTFLIGKGNNDKIMNFSERWLAGSVQPQGRKSWWHRQAALIGVETYSCAISSLVLELASKWFARNSKHVHDPEVCKTAAAPPTAASANGTDDPPAGTKHADKVKAQKECASCVRAT